MKQPLTVLLWLMAAPMILLGAVPPGTAPRFTIEPEDRVVVAQRNNVNVIERFPCSFDGPNITVTWYRNDMLVSEDTSHIIHDNGTLEVTAIVMGVDATTDGMIYHCVLSNEVGSVRSRPALIQLASFGNDWNSVASNTTMVDVTLGSYILLPCNPPMANPAPMVTWTLDSSPIDISTTDKYKVLPSGDLIVGNVVMDDISDMYRCQVVNKLIFETIDSPYSYQLRQVDRYSENLTIYNTLENTILQIGSNAELVCLGIANDITRLESFYSRNEFEDLDDNVMGPMSTTSTNIDHRHTLFIDGVGEDNAGEYLCSLRDFVMGSTIILVTVRFNISVFAPPMITSSPDDITMYTGDSIPIPCAVTGLPAPSISYRVNTSMLSVTDGMLTTVSVTDSGVYQCFVENIHGVVTASWTITVRDPVPATVTEVKGVGDSCIIRNENTNLTCLVTGVPTPTIQWFRSGGNNDRVTITNDSIYTVMGNILIIYNVIDDDADRYGCTATNIVNGTEKTASAADTFSVCAFPAANILPISGEPTVVGGSVRIRCSGSGDPEPTYMWFKEDENGTRANPVVPGRVEVGLDHTTMGSFLEFAELVPSDSGTYVCVVSNSAGTRESVTVLEVEATAEVNDNDFPLWAIIVAAIGGATILMVIVIVISTILLLRRILKSRSFKVSENPTNDYDYVLNTDVKLQTNPTHLNPPEPDPAYSHQYSQLQHKSDGATTGFARAEVDPAYSHQYSQLQHKSDGATTGFAKAEVDPAYSHQHTTPLQQMGDEMPSEYARQETDPAYSHQHTQHKSDGEPTGFARPEVDPAYSHQHTASVQYKSCNAITSKCSRQEIDPAYSHRCASLPQQKNDGATFGLKQELDPAYSHQPSALQHKSCTSSRSTNIKSNSVNPPEHTKVALV